MDPRCDVMDVMDMGIEWETGEPSSISSQVLYIHLRANNLGKCMNLSLWAEQQDSLRPVALGGNQSTAEKKITIYWGKIIYLDSVEPKIDRIAQAFITYGT